MIPQFPNFKKLELKDKDEIYRLTAQYPPYSDFDFVSMWSWDFKEEIRISSLNGNLVVKFTDYVTGEPFYSFLGTKEVNATTDILLKKSSEEGLVPRLKLIPEIVIHELDMTIFFAKSDPDHTDYVLSTDLLATYEGYEYASKRRAVNQFIHHTEKARFAILDLELPETITEMTRLFLLWLEQKNISVVEDHEFTAFQRCLESPFRSELIAAGLYIDQILSAFWLIGSLGNSFAISHFEKADTKSHIGIFPYLKQQAGKELREKGIRFINLEQDLGILGLRQNKKSFNPVMFLQKYAIEAVSQA